jgi:hypothetical protein
MRWRSTLVAGAMLIAMCLTGGGRLMASSGGPSRGQFLVDLAGVLNIGPAYGTGTAASTEVPASSPVYGYVEAATLEGWLRGVSLPLQPNLPLTWGWACQVAMNALRHPEAGRGGSCLPEARADGLPIPAASAEGLVGWREESALLVAIQRLVASSQPGALQVLVPRWAKVGQPVIVSVVARTTTGAPVPTPQVHYSVAGFGARLMGDTFVATQPGVFTLTAATGTGVTGSARIVVYGPPAGLRLVTVPQLVADGQDRGVLAVEIVDRLGHRVYDARDWIELTQVAARGAVRGFRLMRARAVGGLAQFALVAGTRAGVSDVLVARDVSRSVSALAIKVSALAQVLHAFAIRAPTYVVSTSKAPTFVQVQPLDQRGFPIVSGAVRFTASLAGPATFADGGQTVNLQFQANGGRGPSIAWDEIGITPETSATATISLTVTAPGASPASVQMAAVVPGPPAAVELSAPARTAVPQTALAPGRGLQYGVTVVDAHGYPVPVDMRLAAQVQRSGGGAATTIAINGQVGGTVSVPVTNGVGSIVLTDVSSTADAGTYTLLVADPKDALAAPAPASFTVTAGPPATFTARLEGAYVSAVDPFTAVDIQVTDRFGNPASAAGIPVLVRAAPGNPRPLAVVPSAVNTDAQGRARVLFLAPPYPGYTYGIEVTVGVGRRSLGTTRLTFSVERSIAASVAVHLIDAVQSRSDEPSSTVTAGDAITIDFQVKDSEGRLVPSDDQLAVRIAGAGSLANVQGASEVAPDRWIVETVHGSAVVTAIAAAAGTFTVSATDMSVAAKPSTAASFLVLPGPPAAFAFSGPNGEEGQITTQANDPTPVRLTLLDWAGNVTAFSRPTAIDLRDPGGGEFRLTPSGSDLRELLFQPGQTSADLYFVTGASGVYDVRGDAALQVPTAVAGSRDGETFAVSPGETVVLTYTVTDQEGNPIPFLPLHLELSNSGSDTSGVPSAPLGMVEVSGPLVTDESGQVQVTYVAGAGAPGAGETFETLRAEAQGIASGTVTFLYESP